MRGDHGRTGDLRPQRAFEFVAHPVAEVTGDGDVVAVGAGDLAGAELGKSRVRRYR
ncbi:hypothetical protein GCM10029964_109170 [Kibdelosporangium lantanae]